MQLITSWNGRRCVPGCVPELFYSCFCSPLHTFVEFFGRYHFHLVLLSFAACQFHSNNSSEDKFNISEAWMFLLSSLQWALYTQWVSLAFEFPGDLACLLCKGLNLSLQKKINNNKLMSNNHSLNPVVKVNIRAWQSDISEDFKVPYPRSQGHYKLNYVLPLDMKILRYSFLLNNSLETNFQRP